MYILTRLSAKTPRVQHIFRQLSSSSRVTLYPFRKQISVRANSTMSVDKPLEILLVGLGSMGSIYAHILEKVRDERWIVLIGRPVKLGSQLSLDQITLYTPSRALLSTGPMLRLSKAGDLTRVSRSLSTLNTLIR